MNVSLVFKFFRKMRLTLEKEHSLQEQEAKCSFKKLLLEAPPEERVSMLSEHFRSKIAEILDMRPEQIQIDTPFSLLNPDWNNQIELHYFLRSLLRREFNLLLYPREFPALTSVRVLSEYLAKELAPPPAPEAMDMVTNPCEGGNWLWDIPPRPSDGAKRNQGIVFIFSAPRAGSTLLRIMLAGHPALFSPPELNLLPFDSMAKRRRQVDELGYSWMRSGPGSAFAELENLTSEQVAQRLEQLEQEDVSIQQVYNMLQELAGGRLLVDKSPLYASHPAWLRRAEYLFHGSKYLHLVRHPCAAIESFVRMRFHRLLSNDMLVWDENPWLMAEKFWDAANIHILEFLKNIETSRQHRVLYEDLVSNPSAVLSGICSFLNIPFEEAVLKPYEGNRMTHGDSREQFTIGDPNFLNYNRVDPSRATVWKKARPLQQLGEFTRRLSAEFGYELPHESQ